MALFQFLWLRRLIRRHTKPIAHADAAIWKRRLSIMYMIAAWNAFGVVAYMIFTGRSDWAQYYGYKEKAEGTSAQQWTKTLGIKTATVYKVSGLNVQKYEIQNDIENEDQQQNETSISLAETQPERNNT